MKRYIFVFQLLYCLSLFGNQMPGKLFVISGSSGAGKTTLINKLIDDLGSSHTIERLITYTTRAPRANEFDGVDYHFVSEQEFKKLLAADFFWDWSAAYGNYYGCPKFIDDINQGKSYIIILDLIGATRISKTISDVVLIWIDVASPDVLKERLQLRGDAPDRIEKRLQLAQQEMEEMCTSSLMFHRIVNDDFEKASADLKNIVIESLKR